ncbi:hypothetical protein JY96_02575 [Aquabacterium sp. NJ1]|uniref:hypothetical protein n=1 Tax=Aquabacterium sp. NJ1 TaxID=1538295 RepID=UPI00052C25E8|nr:hypothetical protein [Aquabacterium sp. NJ1]KGM39284.1 hypothetical protein JY96_02575 [Aquabacterium sp. NJ1]
MPLLPRLGRHLPPLLSCLATLTAWDAQAGRPLLTDDASVNDQGQCQIETWVDSTPDARSHHFAPACGLIDGLELGFELIRVAPSEEHAQTRAFGVKWAPDWATWQGWRFGLKAGTSSEKAADGLQWHQSIVGFSTLASVPLDAQWTLHLNLGRERNKLDQVGTNNYGAALAWAPHERWLVFAEVVGHGNTPATQAVGLRWWLLPEQLGLDATASRANATPNGRAWGVGLGWYGIKF